MFSVGRRGSRPFGRIDVLINNAGMTRDGRFVMFKEGELVGQMREEDLDLVIHVNLKGVFYSRRPSPRDDQARAGRDPQRQSSVVGLDGNFGQTNYAATKSGVIGMTKVWRASWAATAFASTPSLLASPPRR